MAISDDGDLARSFRRTVIGLFWEMKEVTTAELVRQLEEQHPDLVDEYMEMKRVPMLTQEVRRIRHIDARQRRNQEHGDEDSEGSSIFDTVENVARNGRRVNLRLGDMLKADHKSLASEYREREAYNGLWAAIHEKIAARMTDDETTEEAYSVVEIEDLYNGAPEQGEEGEE